MQMHKRVSAVVAGMVLTASMMMPLVVRGEDQPHMKAAMDALVQAKQHLQQAEHDKGGHRAKALQHVDMAMQQVRMGMNYDTRQENENRKEMKKKGKSSGTAAQSHPNSFCHFHRTEATDASVFFD